MVFFSGWVSEIQNAGRTAINKVRCYCLFRDLVHSRSHKQEATIASPMSRLEKKLMIIAESGCQSRIVEQLAKNKSLIEFSAKGTALNSEQEEN